jgi:hypothetical protein
MHRARDNCPPDGFLLDRRRLRKRKKVGEREGERKMYETRFRSVSRNVLESSKGPRACRDVANQFESTKEKRQARDQRIL